MHELLDTRGALPLDAKKLRRIAYELGSNESKSSRLTDSKVLKSLLGVQHPQLLADHDLVSMALLVAREYDTDLNPIVDIERNENGSLELGESFWRRIVAKITGQPWVFILNYADNQASAIHEDVHGISYGFHEDVTTWRGIVASGSGSVVVFYNTSNAPQNPKCYSGVARVREIEERPISAAGKQNWRAYLEDFHEIEPVRASEVKISNRNVQHGIQAISWNSYQDVIALGKLQQSADKPIPIPSAFKLDEVQKEVDFSIVASRAPDLIIPDFVAIDLDVSPLESYAPKADDSIGETSASTSRRNRELDKLTEVRAVEIATTYMASKGWALRHDRQRDGVGYDLEFQKNGMTLFVEVKGIRGKNLAFNMTAKEWHKCVNTPQFLLIAITRALDNETFQIHPMWPEQICKLSRQATQFRLTPVK